MGGRGVEDREGWGGCAGGIIVVGVLEVGTVWLRVRLGWWWEGWGGGWMEGCGAGKGKGGGDGCTKTRFATDQRKLLFAIPWHYWHAKKHFNGHRNSLPSLNSLKTQYRCSWSGLVRGRWSRLMVYSRSRISSASFTHSPLAFRYLWSARRRIAFFNSTCNRSVSREIVRSCCGSIDRNSLSLMLNWAWGARRSYHGWTSNQRMPLITSYNNPQYWFGPLLLIRSLNSVSISPSSQMISSLRTEIPCK